CRNADEIVILFYVNKDEVQQPVKLIHTHIEGIKALLSEGIGFSCGFGRPVWSEGDIHLSYKQAISALKYTFVYGLNAIISYDELQLREVFEKKMAYEGYQNALRAADSELVRSFLDDFTL